jgi:hypothetical protein
MAILNWYCAGNLAQPVQQAQLRLVYMVTLKPAKLD